MIFRGKLHCNNDLTEMTPTKEWVHYSTNVDTGGVIGRYRAAYVCPECGHKEAAVPTEWVDERDQGNGGL